MSNQLDDKQLTDLADRYLAMWNESDAEIRRTMIHDLWAADGAQILVDPPQAMREAVAELAFPLPPLEVRGHDLLERRATRAYEMFVAPGHVFVPRGPATQLSVRLVGFGWAMAQADGTVVGGGYDILALDDDGRIRLDHQHIGID
ncbi:hypothetical protein [Nocardia sp. NPDC050710]|uniref:hypothetical protein n=1 Tax=Nocardia sp. NPDC050710 TaxID=3157220 RepID=UPI0033EF6AD7